MTDLIQIDPRQIDADGIAHAADTLRRGGLVAFPTETVYGLGAHALDRGAILRLFEAKGRPSNDPLIVHVSTVDLVLPLVTDISDAARRVTRRFWPGPLTLVLAKTPIVPAEVTAGLGTVAVRIPDHPIARALLERAAIPVAAPSANLFSRPSPTSAAHVLQDLDGRIDLVIDGGSTTLGVESTVLDMSGRVPIILRPGAVTLEMLRDVLPDVEMRSDVVTDPTVAMPSPGLLSRHYSPRATLTLYEGETETRLARLWDDARAGLDAGLQVGVILADEDRVPAWPSPRSPLLGTPRIVRLGHAQDLTTVAAQLYAALRELDAAGVDVILARSFPPGTGIGIAVADRLHRAAAGRVIHC